MANKRNEKEVYWRGIFADLSESGLSHRRFCQQRELKYSSFKYWYRKLNPRNPRLNRSQGNSHSGAGDEKEVSCFIPIRLSSSEEESVKAHPHRQPGFDLTLTNGYRLHIPSQFDPVSLSRLIILLESD